jgi:hypothetical protein
MPLFDLAAFEAATEKCAPVFRQLGNVGGACKVAAIAGVAAKQSVKLLRLWRAMREATGAAHQECVQDDGSAAQSFERQRRWRIEPSRDREPSSR